MVAGLVGEMTGEPVYFPPPGTSVRRVHRLFPFCSSKRMLCVRRVLYSSLLALFPLVPSLLLSVETRSVRLTCRASPLHVFNCGSKSFVAFGNRAPLFHDRCLLFRRQDTAHAVLKKISKFLSSVPLADPPPPRKSTHPPTPILAEAFSPPRQHRRRRSPSGLAPVATTTSTSFGIQFPSTPGRPPTPLSSPRSPFPEWAANIFRSSTGGGPAPFENGEGLPSANLDRGGDGGGFGGAGGGGGGNGVDNLPPMSPRLSVPSKPRQLRRAASTSWW